MSDQTILIAGAGNGARAQTAFIQRSAPPIIKKAAKFAPSSKAFFQDEHISGSTRLLWDISAKVRR